MKTFFIILVSILFTYNCAITANTQKMTVTDFTSKKTIGENVFVEESTGGSITLPFWVSKISDENFTQAVKDSLINSKTFNKIVSNTNSDWKLKIVIIDHDHPWFGFDMTVTTSINYTLFLKDKSVFSKTFVESGTATGTEMLIGVYRLKRANEYSAKNNIKKFISELDSLDLKPETNTESPKLKK
ncbi:MAG TPA: hypothetical protein PK079_21750 [Leptospiraceae bacterium]|nr:hypothetical protein [Leptospiraceae bacterium]HMW08182.1 hypothetical protein [Leptospiraceae bacterium]HMY33985.1 hypothetical protein [Leptospiraceae bacterium]HMZ66511.1 hypothetical protein [Leptospiraceae bacterium]HNA09403.1 hypothetical protein [Leptospiraceae bacterium]